MKKTFMNLLMLLVYINVSIAQENPLWLRYPAISPDGNSIAFTYKGDIYKVNSTGGTAIALTTNQSIDYNPVWSPDGKKIAFASNRYGNFDIFIMNAQGGKAERLTFFSLNEKPSSFTPDSKNILFEATIQDPAESAQFPQAYLSELYQVPASGGRTTQIIAVPAQEAKYNADMSKIIFHDSKGPENYWRKHHTSSITRDIFIYDKKNDKYSKITESNGEDRDPIFDSQEKNIFFLSENIIDGFNVCKLNLSNPEEIIQLTSFKKHPVRFLSKSNKDELCFGYNGEIYTYKEGENPVKVHIKIFNDSEDNALEYIKTSTGATEIAVSPDGKQIAFIVRGNVFVTSDEYATTKQITATPEQERYVSFSPDGKKILYASERNNSWNLYQTEIVNPNEKYFSSSSILKEEIVLQNDDDTYQASYSPDANEIAYLANRTELQVLNLKTKKTRTVLPGKYNYSYADGDQSYQWSPDSKYFLVKYSPNMLFTSDIALVNADAKSEPVNLTQSGYSNQNPKWVLEGNAMIWDSEKYGYKSHGGGSSQSDIFIMFFNKDAYYKFTLSKEEYLLYKENQDKDKKKDPEKKEEEKKDNEKKDDEKDKIKPIIFELDNIEDRIIRLTINSSAISDAVLSPDGEKLFYLSKFEQGYDLWVKEIRENTTKIAVKFPSYSAYMNFDKKGDNIFLMAGAGIYKIKTSDYKKDQINFSAEYYLDKAKEREYMFYHTWRLIYKKFYTADMHGVDWEFYKKEYQKFLVHINNNFDFAEMLSEMLGELNASHTGSGYRHSDPLGDKTADLGIFIDFNFKGKGLKIVEVMENGPLYLTYKIIKPGFIIEKIDTNEILPQQDFFRFLNHKQGKTVALTITNPENKETWIEYVKPISLAERYKLLYERRIKLNREETHRLSNGKIGYIHIQGMNSNSFRTVYSDLLGKEYHKDAVVVDSRYNHGGWLHDDLVTLLDGKRYLNFEPRGQKFGYDPYNKWTKPSAILVCEGNYSDAHGFPFAYKELNIGKSIGMPVPGTMTAVWWEVLQDNTLYFGIPQVGTTDNNGNFLENKQFEPDFKIVNEYNSLIKGKDLQLQKAVEVLLAK